MFNTLKSNSVLNCLKIHIQNWTNVLCYYFFSINNSYQDHSSYSSQSSDKSADGIYIEKNGPEVSIQRGFTEIPIKRTNSSSSLLPKSVTSTPVAVKKKVSREPSYDRNSQVDRMSCEELAMFLASLASIPNMIIFLNIHLYYYYHCLSPNFQIWWRTITLARTL